MDIKCFVKQWKKEEDAARIHGWDFSHIEGRYEESGLPWDYKSVIRAYLEDDFKLLDIDTGGGEFVLSLGHPNQNISATEGFPPNIELCRKVLLPLNIDFQEADDVGRLPFPDASFDMVINRHGRYCPEELYRLLKPNSLFITQQVGTENDRELVDLLLPGTKPAYPEQYLDIVAERFKNVGFEVVREQEAFPIIRFYDVGALVWFARVIEWEFPGFSVDACCDQLVKAQRLLEKNGALEASAHRFLLVAKKQG